MAGQTQATAIAALEARRNEAVTLAAGAVAGERRAAVARIAMVVMFACCSELLARLGGPQRTDWQRLAVGGAYAMFAVATLLAIVRVVDPTPEKARLRGALLTLVDFGFVTFMGMSDMALGRGYHPELGVAAAAILITFTIARNTVWHVVLAVVCASISFVAVAARAGHLDEPATGFVLCGFVALGLLVGLTNGAVRRMFRDLRRRDNLTRFLPRPVAERVMERGPESLAPVQCEVTVLFSDLRGFTSLAENLTPHEVLELLDDYFGRMAQIVKGHDGVVGKYLGDGLLAFWGVPDRDPDHALKAVRAALDMGKALIELNRYRAEDGQPPLRVGIGIHTGPVAAGMLGGVEHAEYTIIGDAVNVASRIEELTKQLGADLLISDTTWSGCGGRVKGRRLESAAIRGRREPVVLHAVELVPAGEW